MTLTAKQLFPRSAFVGFDNILDELDRISRHSGDNFPPHNVLKTEEDKYQIELAVAGFSENEIEVEMVNRTLTVSGRHEDRGRSYIHKGISTKKFQKQFRLSEYVEVTGADFKDGLLAINLEVIIPESQRPRKISINSNEVINDNTTEDGLSNQ
jgi:molecular chaperone IbpA